MAVKPIGWYNKFLVIDCETTGLNFDQNSHDITLGYQSVSWGFIVSDMKTMKPLSELYVEIKWDGESEWHWKAAKTHGLTKAHLEENGMTGSDAADAIVMFLAEHFEVEDTIICMGINVARFDIPFLKKLLLAHGYPVSFSHRCLDVSSLAAMTIGTFTSQEMFDVLQVPRGDVHNALEDCRATLTSARLIRKMFNAGL